MLSLVLVSSYIVGFFPKKKKKTFNFLFLSTNREMTHYTFVGVIRTISSFPGDSSMTRTSGICGNGDMVVGKPLDT